jgi:multidrug efflux pump subunit AcrA (membrane-fusion protein)
MRTELHLLAFKSRLIPMIHGTIKTRSADRLVDQRTGMDFYLIQVAIDKDELAALPELKLVPGMPVDVTIPTQARTALQYLISPLTQNFRHAFNEK